MRGIFDFEKKKLFSHLYIRFNEQGMLESQKSLALSLKLSWANFSNPPGADGHLTRMGFQK
jgi:hypothetical protein